MIFLHQYVYFFEEICLIFGNGIYECFIMRYKLEMVFLDIYKQKH